MTITQGSAPAARRAESVLADALDNLRNGLQALTSPFQTIPSAGNLPRFDAEEAVELQFNFLKRMIDVNYGYARQLAEATDTVSGAARERLEELSTAMVEQLKSVSQATQGAVDGIEETVRETAEEAARLQRETQRQAEKAEQEQRRQALKTARANYRSLNKKELSDEAAKRDLPTSGTVNELVERLVENDANK
jgi:hypothetical protein